MNTKHEYIAAIAALHRILEIKKYGLVEDYSALTEVPLVQEMNTQGLEKTGINLISADSISSPERYAAFLNQKLSSNLNVNGNETDYKEELLLLNKAESVNPEILKRFDVQFGESAQQNAAIKVLNLNKPKIKALIKTASGCQIIQLNSQYFLVTARISFNLQEIIILFVLSGNKLHNKELNLHLFFVFNADNPRANSPARLFIQAISKYGIAFSVGDNSKKYTFLLEATVPNLRLRGNPPFVTFVQDKDLDFHASVKASHLGVSYEFSYCVNPIRILHDITRRRFI